MVGANLRTCAMSIRAVAPSDLEPSMATKTTTDLTVTTDEHPNALRLREGFAAFGNGDLDTVRDQMTADCTWVNAGNSAIAGTHQGWEAISAMFGALLEATGGTFSMTLVSVLADDRQAVAVYDATSTVKGRR